MSRLTLLALAAAVVLGGCVERRTVYRDGPGWGVTQNDRYYDHGRVVCDRGDRVCYKNGWPNRSATQDAYGNRAVRRGWW
jgi:hypothetical protein